MRFALQLPVVLIVVIFCFQHCHHQVYGFLNRPETFSNQFKYRRFYVAKGFGGSLSSSGKKSKKVIKSGNKRNRLLDTLQDRSNSRKTESETKQTKPFVWSEQNDLIEALAAQASKSSIGQVVANAQQNLAPDETLDPFWELIPSLIRSRFPNVSDESFTRVAGMIEHALSPNPKALLDQNIIDDPWRPHDEIHAYMPGLGDTLPFFDPSQLAICKELSDNFQIIKDEYKALLQEKKDRFQSVTNMNYESGWKTLVLFYNGHRIPDFPYDLCPRTTELLERLPLAGRIAGFNRQAPSSGIPLHSDGNNMWLTLQMGIQVPDGEKAWIRVGPETKRWKEGECILYDTTYEHETMNEHESQERVVLHIDFFNTLRMTPVEIEAMRYIYSLREEFMKAEGISKVGMQISVRT